MSPISSLPVPVPASAVEVLSGPSARRVGGGTRTQRSQAHTRSTTGRATGGPSGARSFVRGAAPLFSPPQPGVDAYEHEMGGPIAFLGFYVDILL